MKPRPLLIAALVLYHILRDMDLDALIDALEATDWRTLVAVSTGIDSRTMISLAFQQLAENAGKIGELNVSPDLLNTLLRPTRGDGKGS